MTSLLASPTNLLSNCSGMATQDCYSHIYYNLNFWINNSVKSVRQKNGLYFKVVLIFNPKVL